MGLCVFSDGCNTSPRKLVFIDHENLKFSMRKPGVFKILRLPIIGQKVPSTKPVPLATGVLRKPDIFVHSSFVFATLQNFCIIFCGLPLLLSYVMCAFFVLQNDG